MIVVSLASWGLVQTPEKKKNEKVKMIENHEMLMEQRLLQVENKKQQGKEQEKGQYMMKMKQEEDKLKEKMIQLEKTLRHEKERNGLK